MLPTTYSAKDVYISGQSPDLSKARTFALELERLVQASILAGNGVVLKTSKTDLDGDLAHVADTLGIVLGDAAAANDGLYRKSGSSGAGSWALLQTLAFPAEVTIGTVTTLAAGSSATVTNVGTITAPLLDFGIPVGDTGTAGTNGAGVFSGADPLKVVPVADDRFAVFDSENSDNPVSVKISDFGLGAPGELRPWYMGAHSVTTSGSSLTKRFNFKLEGMNVNTNMSFHVTMIGYAYSDSKAVHTTFVGYNFLTSESVIQQDIADICGSGLPAGITRKTDGLYIWIEANENRFNVKLEGMPISPGNGFDPKQGFTVTRTDQGVSI